MRCLRIVARLVIRRMSESYKLRQSHLGDLHKVWLFLNLDVQPRNLPLLVLFWLSVAGIVSRIARVI